MHANSNRGNLFITNGRSRFSHKYQKKATLSRTRVRLHTARLETIYHETCNEWLAHAVTDFILTLTPL